MVTKERKKQKIIKRVWLKRTKSKKGWDYGLGRFSDGTIRVTEAFNPLDIRKAFGNFGKMGESGEMFRLKRGQRRQIITDLYIACRQELLRESPDKLQEIDKEVS